MKILFNIILFLFINVIFTFGQVSTWKETIESKKGKVQINYYNSENFISDASGKLAGMEYDLLESFFTFCEKKYKITIDRDYLKAESFGKLYNNIKSNAQSGEFAACSFSMTPSRIGEVQFSPKYIPDIEVLICSHNVPLVSDTADFKNIFRDLIALTVPNTTFDEDIRNIQQIIPDLKIEKINSAIEIRDRIANEDNLFSYIELPNYILALKKGINIKRQFLFKAERWGYGFIYPLKSDWEIPIEEYFSSDEFKKQMNTTIVKHLGDDVRELVLGLAKVDELVNDKELSLLNKEREIQDLEIEKQKIKLKAEQFWRYIIIGGAIFVIVIAFLLFKQNKIKEKSNKILISQNEEIREQKRIIEDKNKDITSSITYAVKIQNAALPGDEEFKSIFPKSFIYYQPKDVLSGDFYWVGETKSETTNGHYSLLAVGDCTGHGVPGALVSLMGINNLNISRRRSDINSPAEALDFLNQGIVNTFSSNNQSISDGMDIVMIAIEKVSLILYYAAAINPIYIIRNNEIIILKGDRHSIGKQLSLKVEKFTPYNYQLQKGDKLYLFSDGFADQFGGENDKKFSYKSLRDLLLENHTKVMEEQNQIIESTLNTWKGNTEQTDDICVVGIEV